METIYVICQKTNEDYAHFKIIGRAGSGIGGPSVVKWEIEDGLCACTER